MTPAPTHRISAIGRPASVAAACALAIMTKVPRPRHVKTRLVPPLTFEEAAGLHTAFLRDTADNIAAVSAADACAGVAVYTPVGTEPQLSELLPRSFRLVPQRGDGFGDRLASGVADLLAAGYASACLIDSDSPTLPSAALADAAAALARPGERMVLGPADDGGYYLIGLTRSRPELFADIAWSTDRVLAETIARARELGLDVELLPRWYDVDDGPSLVRLCEELFADDEATGMRPGYGAPHSRQFLRGLLRRDPKRIWPLHAAGSRLPP
ncbi:MAG TPA: TIGR04282 family arsenosugar biosynthesis glycosyltransferase [bacterium]|nr:TIGR04282 family arsenosugar biosynthesis glycosyltransferase [bacterium]